MNNATMAPQSIDAQIVALESQLSGNLLFDADIMDQILVLKRQAGLAQKPEHSQFECFGCGS
jgi:hypothetical protein